MRLMYQISFQLCFSDKAIADKNSYLRLALSIIFNPEN